MNAFRRQHWTRLGATLGMLAVLTLASLAPVHHVHAIKRAFAGMAATGHAHAAHQAGAPAGPAAHCHDCASDTPDARPAHCPVCTLGKMAAGLLPPDSPAIALPRRADATLVALGSLAAPAGRSERTAQPRAPPAAA